MIRILDLEADGFEWDDGNSDKCRKHGLDLGEIEAILVGDPVVYDDQVHSEVETRYRAVGRTEDGRHAVVVFTFRERGDRTLVRPISARYMHKREIESYEEATPSSSSH